MLAQEMANPEQLARIQRQIRHDDIKRNLLTDDQIASISHHMVFEWVKTGLWKKRDFEKWLKTMQVI